MEYIKNNDNEYNNKSDNLVIKKMNDSVSKTRHFIVKDNKPLEGIILSDDIMKLLSIDDLIHQEQSHRQIAQLFS
jgi:hypothetical protein